MVVFGVSSIVLLMLNCLLIYFTVNQRKRRPGEPPLIRHPLPFIGCALEFGRDPLGFLMKLRKKHGDMFTVNMSGWTVHFFANPTDIKIFEKSAILEHGTVVTDFANRVVGQPHAFDESGLLNARGPALLSAIAQGLTEPLNLQDLTEACATISSKSIDVNLRQDSNFQATCPIGLYEFLRKVIFDTTFHMLFGFDASDRNLNFRKGAFYEEFCYYFEQSALLVDRVSINLLPNVRKSRDRLFEFMKEVDLSKRVGVSRLIQDIATISEDCEEERAHHFLILLWAAQANALPAVFWTVYHLLQNRPALNQIMLECDDILTDKNAKDETRDCESGENSQIRKLARSDLAKMAVLDACIKESLRIAGSSMVVRKAMRDGSISISTGERFSVRKGDYAMFYSGLTHMDPELFASPKQYNYHRHILPSQILFKGRRKKSDDSAISVSEQEDDDNLLSVPKARRRYSSTTLNLSSSTAILTFGCGGSRCPGRHLATAEIKLIILHLFKYYNVQFGDVQQKTPVYDMKHLGFGVMPPASDVKVRVTPK